ncbi:hypothetical protein DPEC_G00115030 [Dallia pectoralis]|uniref:Uncharacterized protein n=1 Tax=Dallia pectoralis TaxID=75939 RepID=A0ACC2GUG4_DALPE|nr:hypothetical protein DPEC_G00115030 [Dallia pectoralis]
MTVHSRRITSKPFPRETNVQDELLTTSVPLLTSPQTSVLTTLVKPPPRTTDSLTQLETTLTRQPVKVESQTTSQHTSVPTTGSNQTISTEVIEIPRDPVFSGTKVGPTAEQTEPNTPTMRKDGAQDRTTSTTPGSLTVTATAAREQIIRCAFVRGKIIHKQNEETDWIIKDPK